MARERRQRRRPRRGWAGGGGGGAPRSGGRGEGGGAGGGGGGAGAAAALGIRSAQTLKWERERDRWPSLDAAVARWGSWRQALQSAGLPTYPPLVLGLQERVAMARRVHGVASVDETAELVGLSRW